MDVEPVKHDDMLAHAKVKHQLTLENCAQEYWPQKNEQSKLSPLGSCILAQEQWNLWNGLPVKNVMASRSQTG